MVNVGAKFDACSLEVNFKVEFYPLDFLLQILSHFSKPNLNSNDKLMPLV